MIVIIGEIRVSPETVGKAQDAMRAMITASRAEEGCSLYAFAEDVLEPGVVRISEKWESWEALAAHAETEHMAVWRKALAEYDILHRDVAAYVASDEKAALGRLGQCVVTVP